MLQQPFAGTCMLQLYLAQRWALKTGGMWLAYGLPHRMLTFDSLVPCLSHPLELQVGHHKRIIIHTSSTGCIAVRTLLYNSAAILINHRYHIPVSSWSESAESAG